MWNKRNSFMKNTNKLKKKERNISKRNTTSLWIRFNYENRLGIQIWIFLHQVLDYHDVSMKHNCTWFYIAAVWYMLDVVAYICNYTYKFLDATLFMLDVLALAYSDTYPSEPVICLMININILTYLHTYIASMVTISIPQDESSLYMNKI